MASTSNHQTPSSSASSPAPTAWHVFLSFRGEDTRYTFTDHLYKALDRDGIRTFKDHPELRSGEVISDSLIQAIRESKTYIVVLSKNYASSPWCLDELVEILDCFKSLKRLVVPVFYHIDPSIVRHQVGRFREAFEKHQTRFGKEKVDMWRRALIEVANFSGYHVSKNKSEADIVAQVVGRVSLDTNPRTLNVAKYRVGLHSHVKAVTELFNSDTRSVVRIGIHGMGGVGKTTLAKEVYNQNCHSFPGSCFLANVREASKTETGKVRLQQQLLNDVLRRKDITIDNVDQGIEMIRDRICSTKVLIVIDDIDDRKPLEFLEGSFAPGSIVIITTRNEDLLDRIRVKAKYKINPMDKDQSQHLFTQHAFGENKISDTFTQLSKVILEHAGGLPLALQVFGSTLLDESEDRWRWFMDKLKRSPINDIEENLMISFDALKMVDPDLQDIFLDIACFYIGCNETQVTKILETCYSFVNPNIDILKKRCLLTIDKDFLGMHDLLRDMGRRIACNNSPAEPEKYNRLWEPQVIDTVLANHKGTEAIQGIISTNFHNNGYQLEGVSFAAETFKRMSKLRFLYLDNANLRGSFNHIFDDLRWFLWYRCPLNSLPSEFCAPKLVSLELPQCRMRTMWELNTVPQGFKHLKTLNMSSSPNLTTTPDFTNFPGLETLNFKFCRSLGEVHVSIGSLVRLVSLDLSGCCNLRSLPDSICNSRTLEVLSLGNCRKLEALPAELGNIGSLKELHMSEASVSKLPFSIGSLSNLVSLDLSQNRKLETLPSSIGNMESLKILNLNGCCEPDQLWMLPSSRGLNVKKATLLKKLPDISQLSQLERLEFSGLLTIAELPPNLLVIQAANVPSLRPIRNRSKSKLEFTGGSALTELQGPGELIYLEHLEISDCANLLSILERAPNLKTVEVRGSSFNGRVLDLSNLKQLQSLVLYKCSGLIEIQGLKELSSLEFVKIHDCANLLSIPKLPTNLKWIDIVGFTSLQRLPDLSELKWLTNLDVTGCSGLTEIIGLEKLTSLEFLWLKGNNSSLSTSILNKYIFQIFSGFGHELQIQAAEFPEWISPSSGYLSPISLDLQPNAYNTFQALILCFASETEVEYEVKNIRSGFTRTDSIVIWRRHRLLVIVPSSLLSIQQGDYKIEVKVDGGDLVGIHLLYKMETTKIGSTRVDVEEERSSHSQMSDMESKFIWLSPGTTTVNVEEERRNPADNNMETNKKRLSLDSSSITDQCKKRKELPS